MSNLGEVSSSADSAVSRPETVDQWAADYLAGESPLSKLQAPAVPAEWIAEGPKTPIPERPARGGQFQVAERAAKTPRPGALRRPEALASLLHTFLHHEVQAAELYCRAILQFRGAPAEFRRGLLRVALDEIRHAGLYQELLLELGSTYGSLPVRDWFWQRVVGVGDPIAFVSFVGLGLEAANLDHSQRFVAAFHEVGAERAAAVQEQIEREEESHVRFAQQWFLQWTDGSFEEWCKHLPKPLSPLMFSGRVINRKARERAGQSTQFLDAFEAWARSGS